MHVVKLVNKRKRSTACLCSMTVSGSAVICVSGWWHHFQGGMPRPVVHGQSLDSTPMSKQCHEVRHAETWSAKVKTVTSLNLTETQTKNSVANKLVDLGMENMYSKINTFATFHLYFEILFWNICVYMFTKYIIFLNTLILFAKHYLILQYLNYLANICGIV